MQTLQSTTRTVGILGGMGPAAGADFARLFVAACAEQMRQRGIVVSDQAFPEHWLAQVPVPDRGSALGTPGFGAHQPLDPCCKPWASWLRWVPPPSPWPATLRRSGIACCNSGSRSLRCCMLRFKSPAPLPLMLCARLACWQRLAATAQACMSRRLRKQVCNATSLVARPRATDARHLQRRESWQHGAGAPRLRFEMMRKRSCRRELFQKAAFIFILCASVL